MIQIYKHSLANAFLWKISNKYSEYFDDYFVISENCLLLFS